MKILTYGLNLHPKVLGGDVARYYVCFHWRHYYWVKEIHIGSL